MTNEQRLRKVLEDVIAAWDKGWDCSAHPDHWPVRAAIARAEAEIAEIYKRESVSSEERCVVCEEQCCDRRDCFGYAAHSGCIGRFE